jgi:shikimate dehydrogenase
MQEVYRTEELRGWLEGGCPLDPPAKLAVLGDPVAHSRSPQMHGAALEAAGIAASYIRVEVPVGGVAECLGLLGELGFVGANVTVPHKGEALAAVGEADELAREAGAVNTVLFEEGGGMVGFNTDGPGLVRALREEFSVDLRDLQVLVLGAGGGAGRAVAVQCAREGCERLVLANRTVELAKELAAELSPRFAGPGAGGPLRRLVACGLDERELAPQMGSVDVVINATSVGLKRTDGSPFPARLLQPHLLVYDMIYEPARTALLRDAEAAGCRVANGLSMLVHQGAVSFEHWFGREPDLAAMRRGAGGR